LGNMVYNAQSGTRKLLPVAKLRMFTENFFRIINDFVHRFNLDHTFVDFTVSLLILPFYIVVNGKINNETVKSTLKPLKLTI
jgi:hypothetical protein